MGKYDWIFERVPEIVIIVGAIVVLVIWVAWVLLPFLLLRSLRRIHDVLVEIREQNELRNYAQKRDAQRAIKTP